MLRIISTLFCIILFSNLFTQHTFELLLSNDQDQAINDVIEDQEGNYILVGKIKNSQTNYYDGYLLRISSNGELLNELSFHNIDNGSLFFNILKSDSSFYILGEVFYETQTSYSAYLWLLNLNIDLVVTNEWFLNIPEDRWFSYMKSIIDSDTNIVITGYTTREDTVGFSPYNFDPFFYKTSLSGDSLSSKFMTLAFSLTMSNDIVEKSDKSGYYAFGNDFADLSQTGQRFELGKSFDSVDIVKVPYRIRADFSSISLNDTLILICGEGGPETTPDYSINVLSHTENNLPINYNYFKIEGNMRDRPACFYGLSKNEDNIYVGGTSNLDFANPFYSSLDSWFHLIKINPDITPIWEYWYGGDAYYHLYSILATNDEGCLMVGTRYDDTIQYLERDIYIIKVNSEGLLVWTQEIPINKPLLTVYPNPGTDLINIKISKGEFEFELININGQVLIKQQINSSLNTVNTESIQSGMYFYKIINKKNKTIETGKWIKK
jgi:hypothetical protein